MENDNFFMKRCQQLGEEAAANGNPPVGAIVTRNGEIISEAAEAGKSKNDVTCHAELEAIRIAVKRLGNNNLSDCDMYTTHEPCVMCSYAIRFYRIKKVIYQNSVKYLGGVSSSMPLLTTQNVPPHWAPPPEIIHLNKINGK